MKARNKAPNAHSSSVEKGNSERPFSDGYGHRYANTDYYLLLTLYYEMISTCQVRGVASHDPIFLQFGDKVLF